jgi:hypothetical protein
MPKSIVTVHGSDRFRSDDDQRWICLSNDGRIIATENEGSIDRFRAYTGERLEHFTTKSVQLSRCTRVELEHGDRLGGR